LRGCASAVLPPSEGDVAMTWRRMENEKKMDGGVQISSWKYINFVGLLLSLGILGLTR
jgi:hypothetical protein